MGDLPRPASVFIGFLTAGAATLLGVMLVYAESPSRHAIGIALVLAGCVALAHLLPLHYSGRTVLTLDTTVIFAAVLLLDPGLAMLSVAIGTVLALLLRRRATWFEAVFNTAQAVLQTGAGGLVLLAVDWDYGAIRVDSLANVTGVILAGAALYLVNSLAVAVMAGLQTGSSPLQLWRQAAGFDAVEVLAQLSLGLLTAVVVDVHAWLLFLMVPPLAAIYLSLKRHIGLRQLDVEREYARRLTDLAVLRADFTAMVAHELQAPISAIRRFTEVAATGRLEPHQAHAIQAITTELDVLGTLVADVQTSAMIERDDFNVRPRAVPLATLVADAEEYVRSLPGNHPLVVSAPGSVLVLADPGRISQVLRNLLNNAAKYSADASPITLRAAAGNGRVRVEVEDRGVGIHPDDIERVFEKFGRGRHHAGGSPPGIGLGLYVSRRIVQAHGTDLDVRSEPNHGTVIGFSLPVA